MVHGPAPGGSGEGGWGLWSVVVRGGGGGGGGGCCAWGDGFVYMTISM